MTAREVIARLAAWRRGSPPIAAAAADSPCIREQAGRQVMSRVSEGQPDDWAASLDETTAETDRRRATWPCSRLLDLLSPELTRIGP